MTQPAGSDGMAWHPRWGGRQLPELEGREAS